MSSHLPAPAMPGFPRFFKFGGYWVNSYRVFLCVGIYVGTLATAAAAEGSGLSPLRIGLGAAACALGGLVGARLYHVLLRAPAYIRRRSWRALWDLDQGGWSVLGAPLTFVPVSLAVAGLLHLPAAVFFDHMALGVVAGGFWIRLGCVFNGCCAGRETQGWLGVRLHDTRGVRKRRIPVQFLEMAWWALGLIAFLWLWPTPFPQGSYALGVLGGYGVGRFFLEPLREGPNVVFGGVRVNQMVAALLALVAGGALVIRAGRP